MEWKRGGSVRRFALQLDKVLMVYDESGYGFLTCHAYFDNTHFVPCLNGAVFDSTVTCAHNRVETNTILCRFFQHRSIGDAIELGKLYEVVVKVHYVAILHSHFFNGLQGLYFHSRQPLARNGSC